MAVPLNSCEFLPPLFLRTSGYAPPFSGVNGRFPAGVPGSGLAFRVDPDPHRLHDGLFHRPINQTDREWHEPVYPRASALKQQPGPFFGTRHQRPLPLVQDKHCQV
jgi:hypothetical protein